MKKVVGVLVAVVIIFILGGLIASQIKLPKDPEERREEVNSIFGVDNNVQIDSGLSYSGKVVPEETFYYTRSATQEVNQVYVEAGEKVAKGDLLFDYSGNSQSSLQVQVLEKNFVNYQEQLNDYYTQLDDLKNDLKIADKNDKIYVNYLNVEINNMEQMIAQVHLNWSNNEQQIKDLKEKNADLWTVADCDGLIYQVNDPKKTLSVNNAYIVLYSSEKKVRLNVSEYEYQYFSEGQEVEIYIEAMDKTYSTSITHVDAVPNNLESSGFSDTSYYFVEISVPEEVPYGFSATVKVPKND